MGGVDLVPALVELLRGTLEEPEDEPMGGNDE